MATQSKLLVTHITSVRSVSYVCMLVSGEIGRGHKCLYANRPDSQDGERMWPT